MSATSRLVPPAVIDVLAASKCAKGLTYTIALGTLRGGARATISVTANGEEPLAWTVELQHRDRYSDACAGGGVNPSLRVAFLTATIERARAFERLAEEKRVEAKRYRLADRKQRASETADQLAATGAEFRALAAAIAAAWPEEAAS